MEAPYSGYLLCQDTCVEDFFIIALINLAQENCEERVGPDYSQSNLFVMTITNGSLPELTGGGD